MATEQYQKDKDIFFKYLFSVLGTIGVTAVVSIYSEIKEMSKGMIRAQDEIQWMQKKNEEQDKRLDKHDEILYLKPPELKIKTHGNSEN